uniref:CRAL-TRIO domain-containing protein n=1 Tax=Phaeomonas parva TaxID=124430 RepID=A0A7S1UI98_9STRA|mmetsp:Transcript_46169/g.144413  ORF Transcript_46169/g.144413 Transcript_46169/m.144413 type:complete len:608 (+) Transcript_46169:61-1884(+)
MGWIAAGDDERIIMSSQSPRLQVSPRRTSGTGAKVERVRLFDGRAAASAIVAYAIQRVWPVAQNTPMIIALFISVWVLLLSFAHGAAVERLGEAVLKGTSFLQPSPPEPAPRGDDDQGADDGYGYFVQQEGAFEDAFTDMRGALMNVELNEGAPIRITRAQSYTTLRPNSFSDIYGDQLHNEVVEEQSLQLLGAAPTHTPFEEYLPAVTDSLYDFFTNAFLGSPTPGPSSRLDMDAIEQDVRRIYGWADDGPMDREAKNFGQQPNQRREDARVLWQNIIEDRDGKYNGFRGPQPRACAQPHELDEPIPDAPSDEEAEYILGNPSEYNGFFRLRLDEYEKYLELFGRLKDVSCVGCRWNPRFIEVLRYLRHAKFKVGNAEQHVRQNARWRKENGVDDILFTYLPPFSLLKFYGSWGLEADDKEGVPVFVWKIGRSDLPHLTQVYTSDEIMQYAVWEREWFARRVAYRRASPSRPRSVGYGAKCTVLADLEGMGFSQAQGASFDAFSGVMDMDQARYPEAGLRTLLIRAPTIFSAAWGIVGKLFQNQDEMLIHSGDPKSLIEEYLNAVDVPEFLGGPNPDIIPPGGPMDEDALTKARLEKRERCNSEIA